MHLAPKQRGRFGNSPGRFLVTVLVFVLYSSSSSSSLFLVLHDWVKLKPVVPLSVRSIDSGAAETDCAWLFGATAHSKGPLFS